MLANGVGGITTGSDLRPLANVPALTGGPSEGAIRNTPNKSFDVAQQAFYEGATSDMKTRFNEGLPKFMGEAVGDVTSKAGDVLDQNRTAAYVFTAGGVAGGAYKLNEAMIKYMSRKGGNPGNFPLGDKIASGARSAASAISEASSKAFASADEAASVAQKMASGLAQGAASEGRGFMVARAGLLGAVEAAGNVATVGYMVYEFNEKAMAMADKDAAAAGFESRDAYLNSQTNPATSSFTPRGFGGGGGDLGSHLPAAPGAKK